MARTNSDCGICRGAGIVEVAFQPQTPTIINSGEPYRPPRPRFEVVPCWLCFPEYTTGAPGLVQKLEMISLRLSEAALSARPLAAFQALACEVRYEVRDAIEAYEKGGRKAAATATRHPLGLARSPALS